MIEAVGLSKYYGNFAACRDVTFSINKGEVAAFLGPNGAGKSTTMKLLTGYLAPSAGTAKIAGFNMSTERLLGAERLGYLPENGPLYPDMSPRSLLTFFGDARGLQRHGAPAAASTRSSRSATSKPSSASRSASSPRATASASAWPRRCCTTPTC